MLVIFSHFLCFFLFLELIKGLVNSIILFCILTNINILFSFIFMSSSTNKLWKLKFLFSCLFFTSAPLFWCWCWRLNKNWGGRTICMRTRTCFFIHLCYLNIWILNNYRDNFLSGWSILNRWLIKLSRWLIDISGVKTH